MKKITNGPVNSIMSDQNIDTLFSVREFQNVLELCSRNKDTDIVYKRLSDTGKYVYKTCDATPNKACLRVAKWLCKEQIDTSDFIVNGDSLEFIVYNGENKMVADPMGAMRSITKLFERIGRKRGVTAVLLRSEMSDLLDDLYYWQVCVKMDNKVTE